MNIFHSRAMKWLGICLLTFIPLVIFYALGQQIRPLEHAHTSTSTDFQYKSGDGEWQDYDPALERTIVSGTYWFQTVLPENRWRDPHMYLVFVPNAEVYLGNERIYAFSPRFDYIEHPHLIRLPDDFAGQTLTIRIDFDRHNMYPGLYMIDSPLQFVIAFFLQSDYRLLLGFISLLVGIAGFMIYIGRRQAGYLHFSLFALYIAQLCAARSWFLLGLLAPSPAFAYFQDVFLPIGAYFFLRFYEHLFGTSTFRFFRWLPRVMIAMFVVELAASLLLPSLYRNELSFLIQNMLAPGTIVVILMLTFHTYRKQRDPESFWLMTGIVTFCLTTFIYFLLPYIYWISDHARSLIIFKILYAEDRFLHGIFILLFCMAMVLNARIRSVYQQARQTAKELKELSNSLEQLVQERTKELEQTNQNLRSSMQKTAEALAEIAVLEDRNRIAQDMHDRTGHALTAALIQIEAAKLLMTKDVNMAKAKLEATRESVASGLESIRETVRMMKLDYEERSLVLSIQKLIQETEAAVGVQIYYDPQPLPDLDPILKKTLYHALQEGVTNGIRHGKAVRFDLSLKAEDNMISFQLSNNGEAYANQEFGFGLNAMRERVERLHGRLQLESNDQHVCVLRITLPLESNDDEKEEAR